MTSLRDVLADLRDEWAAEWAARTTYGKVVFPVWAAGQAVEFAFLFGFLGGLALLQQAVNRVEHHDPEPLFEVYEEDE
jgi:hypothetical protein